jgi:ketosteroid isomerase-like protein
MTDYRPLLEEIYSRWAQGDYTRLDFFDPEIEFVYSDGFPDPGTFRGLDQLPVAWGQWMREWGDMSSALEEIHGDGVVLVAFVVLHGTARASGAPLEKLAANVHEFRDGKMVRMELHPSREDALRAAGLDPSSA